MRSTSKAPCPAEAPNVTAFIQPFNEPILLKYFAAVRSFYGGIKFLGMGSMREKVTKDVHLDTLFVMPRLHSRHVTAAESVSDSSTLDGTIPLLDAVQQHQRLVVLGDPGSGKSTLIQYLSDGLCRTLDSSVRNALGPLVPLPIILRELNLLGLTHAGDFDLLIKAWLGNKLRPVSAAFDGENCLLDQLLTSGQALVLIDGLDEVSDENLRNALCRAIWQGMSRYPRARWIITSRIVGYSSVEVHEHVLHEVGGGSVTGAKIKSALLRNEGKSEEAIAAEMEPGFSTHGERVTQVASLAYVAPFNQPQIEQFARNWMLAMGDNENDAARNTLNFVQGISERPATRLLAPTPVLLTFMGLVYRGSRDFPNGRAELFRLIVRAYVESIEKDKFGSAGIPAGLNVQIVERLLDRIGWEAQLLRSMAPVESDPVLLDSLAQDGSEHELLIAEDTLRMWMRTSLVNVLPEVAVEGAIAALLRYLAERTGLIVPRGRLANATGRTQEHYAFLHLSIQEFMAARWLHERMTDDDWQDKERQRENLNSRKGLPPDSLPVLRAQSQLPEWHEVFFLLHELWQKPTPVFRFFASDPWVHAVSPHAVQSLRDSIVPAIPVDFRNMDSYKDRADMSLLAAVALDASNGLAMHRELRSHVMQALHGRVCRIWANQGVMLSQMLLRQGDLLEASWNALKAEMAEFKPPYLILSDIDWLKDEDIDSICRLNGRINNLFLGSCGGVTNVDFLKYLSSLKELNLIDCIGLSSIGGISGLNCLEEFYLNDCKNVIDLDALKSLNSLQILDISGCTGVTDISALQGLNGLKKLSLHRCTGIIDKEKQVGDLQKVLPNLGIQL